MREGTMLVALLDLIERQIHAADEAPPAPASARFTADERTMLAQRLMALAQRLQASTHPPSCADQPTQPAPHPFTVPEYDECADRTQLAQHLLVAIQTLPRSSPRARLLTKVLATCALALLISDATVTRFVRMIDLFRFPEPSSRARTIPPLDAAPICWRYHSLIIPHAALSTMLHTLDAEGWDLIHLEMSATTFTLFVRMPVS